LATLLSSLETQARRHLLETTASFWSSAELIDIVNLGIKDLWGSIVDLHQEHFLTVDISNVSLAASATQLSGVPADTFRVHLIEPTDTTSAGSFDNVQFVPKDYNSPEFIAARTLSSTDPTSSGLIFYCLTTQGAPVAAPVVLTGPKLSSAMTAGSIRFVYVPTLAARVAAEANPIPGDSDNALIAWCVAYARAKEREDRSPDSAWLAVYATEKMNLMLRLTPRQDQEPSVVYPLFESLW